MGKRGPSLTEEEARDRDTRRAEKKAKKAEKRATTREARAKGVLPKDAEGWSKGIQKGEYGQDIFDGKVHAKWPSMFKQHLGLLESHIKSLDRVMQAMKSEMNGMADEQRKLFEFSENSRMRTMCGLMDRARGTLVSARFASKSIIPPSWQKDKSGLGVTGLKFEPLLPKLQERAEEAGIFWNDNKLDQLWGIQNKKKAAPDNSDSSSGSSSEESSDEDSDSEESEASGAEAEQAGDEANGVEPNPFFVVDTKPTPVNLNGSTPKSKKEKKEKKSKKGKGTEPTSADPTPAKKQSSDDNAEQPTPAKKSKATAIESVNVDFTAVEAQLQAEVQAGLKAKEKEELHEQASKAEEESEDRANLRKEKKRKRNSGVTQVVTESSKKKQRLEVRHKNKDEVAASGDSAGKESKKGKKRKAEGDDAEGKTKKR